MAKILVDTSAWICYFRNEEYLNLQGFIREKLDHNEVATTGIIILELLQGTKTQKEFETLGSCLFSLKILPTPDSFWITISRFAYELKRKGLSIPTTDLVIAYLAIYNECVLLHLDRHFDLIEEHSNLKALSINQLG